MCSAGRAGYMYTCAPGHRLDGILSHPFGNGSNPTTPASEVGLTLVRAPVTVFMYDISPGRDLVEGKEPKVSIKKHFAIVSNLSYTLELLISVMRDACITSK